MTEVVSLVAFLLTPSWVGYDWAGLGTELVLSLESIPTSPYWDCYQ